MDVRNAWILVWLIIAIRGGCIVQGLDILENPQQESLHHGNSTWKQLDFEDMKEGFRGRPTRDLILGMSILKACTFKTYVDNAEGMLKMSRRWLGDDITAWLVRKTFFKQFCGGIAE